MSDEETKKEPESLDTARDDSAESDSEVLEFEFNEDGPSYADALEGEGGDFQKAIKKLKADLKACKAEKEEYLTGWQKERADFANYKKGEEDRKAVFSEAVRERILTRFLSVLDSFNLAFANKESWDKVDENWRKGVEHIYSQMKTIFEEYGVRPIGEVGEPFDPNVHQSIDVVPTDQKENDHKVAHVVQKGYELGSRVIRPARVNVYEYKNGDQ